VKLLPIEKIVVETDAPYLMPEPFRGKNKEIPNTPANIVFTIKKIAELKKISVEEVIKITTNNACSLLKINF
jgi:TatD DNase family protein